MNARPENRSLSIWQAIILLNAACVYAIAAGYAHVPCLVFLGGALAVVIQPAITFNSRRVIYGSVVVFAVIVMETQVFPDKRGTFFLDQTRILVPTLLYAGTALLYFTRRRFVPPLITSFGLLVLLMAGGVIALPPIDQLGVIPRGVVEHFKVWYRCAVIVQIIAMVMVFGRKIKSQQQSDPTLPRRFKGLVAAALVMVFIIAGIGERVALSYEPELNRLYMRFMRLYLRDRNSRVIFDEKVNLWRTSRFRSDADKTIVLRAFSKTAPGYLRSRVYRDYRQGVWTTDSPETTLSQSPAEGMGTYAVFRRRMPGDPATAEWISFIPEVRLESEALFIPGTACRLELIAESARHSEDGVVTHKDWDQRAGYSVERLPSADGAYPLPILTAENRAVYLTLDDNQQAFLAPFVQAVSSDSNHLSDRARMRATVEYLRSRCSYALGVKYNRGSGDSEDTPDPVAQFLGTKRRGHCELFATAAVLMLRAQHIPARYVTGLVCEERLGGYWVARLEYAHAWAEAYDTDSNQWVLVEATPPAGIPGGESQAGWFEKCLDACRTYLRAGMTRIRRGELAGLIMDALVGAWTGVKCGVGQPLFWAFLALLLGIGVKKWRTKKRRELPADADLLALRQLWIRMERWGARRGLTRHETETVAEFADRIEQAPIPARERVVQCLKRYEGLRYHQEARTPRAIQQLKNDWREALSNPPSPRLRRTGQ